MATIDYEGTEDTRAAEVWRTRDLPCAECCGTRIGFVRPAWRQLSLSADPPLTLGGDEPPLNSVMELYRDGCYEVCVPPDYPISCSPLTTEGDRDDCIAVFSAAVDVAEGEVTDAEDDVSTATANLVTAESNLADAESDRDTKKGDMEVERASISADQMELYGLKIRREMYVELGDTTNADATTVLIEALEASIAAHPYWTALEDYNNAEIDVGSRWNDVFDARRSLDLANRKLEIAQFRLSLMQSNLTTAEGSTAPDAEMYRLNLADIGYFLSNTNEVALLSSGTEREGWYVLGLDLSQLISTLGGGFPLPVEETQYKFQWRQVFKPEDTADPFIYSDPMEEAVVVPADTLFALTTKVHVPAPVEEGRIYVVSPPQKAVVEAAFEFQGGSLFKMGFMAYKISDAGVSKIFLTETASGGDDFSGSQTIVDNTLVDTFSEDVPDNAKSPVWPSNIIVDYISRVSEDETERVFANGLVMNLSDEIVTADIQSPVDSYVGDAWGTDPPLDIFSPLYNAAHSVLLSNETNYSAAKGRYKLTVTIPQALPFDVTVTCTWKQSVLTFETGAWDVSEEDRDIVVPAGETSVTEDDWTEITASLGTLVVLHEFSSEEHPDLFLNGPLVSIEPVGA